MPTFLQFASERDADEYARIVGRGKIVTVDIAGRKKCEICAEYHWDDEPHGKTTSRDRKPVVSAEQK